ncbi:unnamed protein product [Oppiella nova]|uniref:Uncharacterized protein n=1 Tax=Oppiella nova TaxID=334625 RepID=A0A7R9M0W8_9ACAR|nr:unnamed protein product [Oppiella nova]CAG2168751.1 unnamed protein product [Oppiella nova]
MIACFQFTFNNTSVLFVTTNDSVYGFGYNLWGFLGLGHNYRVETQLIPQLCGQRIRQFINGSDFMLAMNEDNHVFSWGHNDEGQLGRKIWYLNDKNITQISCGSYHSLALTTGGQVYGWGCNSDGRIGCETNPDENLYKNQFTELSDKPIGSGGFGTVFKVKHKIDEQIYAVKRVEFNDITSPEDIIKAKTDKCAKAVDSKNDDKVSKQKKKFKKPKESDTKAADKTSNKTSNSTSDAKPSKA